MSGAGGLPPNVTPIRRKRVRANWWNRLQTNKSADPLGNLFNAVLALREDRAWADGLGFDEMLQVAVLRSSGAPLADADTAGIHLWMQEVGLEKMGLDTVREAVELVSREHRFHPLRDWLSGLPAVWDGDLRSANWLHRYLGAEDNPYHGEIGVRFLIALVARIFQPGCKADYMLVLEGPQGKLKSQACAILAGEYFSDAMPDLGTDHVRVQMHLRGKWLIEVSELSAFSRAEAAKLKAFLTTRVEPYLPKYARYEVREPRQCLFVGTTNKTAYLRDETGGRRFWPVKCGDIDLVALARDREQLLAEVVCAYQAGAHWWPDPAFEEKFIAPVQASRFDGDAWEKAGDEWDWSVPDPALGNRVLLSPPFYLADIALGALAIDRGKLTKRDEQRLVTVLETLGWQRATRTKKGVPWFPPP